MKKSKLEVVKTGLGMVVMVSTNLIVDKAIKTKGPKTSSFVGSVALGVATMVASGLISNILSKNINEVIDEVGAPKEIIVETPKEIETGIKEEA